MRVLLSLFLAGAAASAYPSGSRIPAGNAGEPGSGTPCASCHRVTLNPSGGSAVLQLPSDSYKAGEAQTWILKISDPDSSKRFGFQLTAGSGALSSPQGVAATSAGKVYLTQTASSSAYQITWTPSASQAGEVKIYVAGVAARGTSSTNVYTVAYTLQPVAVVVPDPVPAFAAANPVLDAATGKAEAAAGSLLAISGENFTKDGLARHWTAELSSDGAPPLELAGVKVRVNQKDAAIVAVSPTRIYALAPEDDARGSVPVIVMTSTGDSQPVSVDRVDSARGIYLRGEIALARHADGALLARAAEFSEPWLGRPATPGQSLAVVVGGLAGIDDLSRIEVKTGELPCRVDALDRGAAGQWTLRLTLPPELEAGEFALHLSVDGQPFAAVPLVPVRR